MITPATAAGQGPARAYIEVVKPAGAVVPVIPLRFNPTEYQVQKANNFAEIPIPGLESPPIQYVRGVCEKLMTELVADTSDTLEDVRKKYTNALRALMDINAELHAPPVVRFTWDGEVFLGVIESLNVTYTLFTPDGIPIRAKLSLTLKEYRPIVEQAKTPKSSPDVEKRHTVRRGDTLSGVAALAWSDPTRWREVARHNGIQDPRRLEPGVELLIPRLT